MSRSYIHINSDVVGGNMINLFKKDTGNPAKLKKKKEKQEERKQRAQARGQKPIK